MPKTSRCIASLALLAASIVAQNDLHVGGTNPGAYQSVSDAYAAAQPGDRILIHTWNMGMGLPVVTKSVTFEATTQSVSLDFAGISQWYDYVDIAQLTPDIPLVFKNIGFSFWWMTSMPPSFDSAVGLVGDIRFESCRFNFSGGPYAPVMAKLHATNAYFLRCNFRMVTNYSNNACLDSWFSLTTGGCLHITCNRLVMEDCDLRAASGAYVWSAPNNCYFGCRPDGSAYSMNAPIGGFAIQANTAETWMTRCRTSDGNGGGAQPPIPPCGSYGIPAPAGVSHFTSANGLLHAFDFVHESGLHGQYATPGDFAPRGPLTQIGEATAPLRLLGNAQLGGDIQANISQPGISLLAMAFAWSPTNTPVGRVAFDLLQQHSTFVVFTTTSPSTQSWSVPNDPLLVGLPVVTQLLPFDPTSGAWRASNPSGIWLQRP